MIKLHPDKYSLALQPIKKVKINTLFARFVIEQKVNGTIYVDDATKPKTFYVVHPYGMSLLFGESNNKDFNQQLLDYCLNKNAQRKTHEWMQASPGDWDNVLPELFGNNMVEATANGEAPKTLIELNTRVNFHFNLEKYHSFKQNNITQKHHIIRTNKNSFLNMKGSVVPSFFWKDAEDFCDNGVGFSLYYQDELATTAYSSFIFDNELELGMETLPEFRGKGFAQYACSALIDYCIDNSYEPIWACRLANTPSYKLAQKLGFDPSITLPYYRLAI